MNRLEEIERKLAILEERETEKSNEIMNIRRERNELNLEKASLVQLKQRTSPRKPIDKFGGVDI